MRRIHSIIKTSCLSGLLVASSLAHAQDPTPAPTPAPAPEPTPTPAPDPTATPTPGDGTATNQPTPPAATPAPEATASGDPFLEGVSDITQVSLNDLLSLEYDVASKTPQTLREAPGAITVVTREEILASGARNLMDILQLVPGFVAESDVEGATSVVFRGLNATDGRMLILLDGHIFNDLLYTFPTLNDRFAVDQIERVEIIRGPGSAIYGGFAELAVINIITRGADQFEGVHASLTLGQFGGAYARQTISLAFAQKFAEQNAAMSGSLHLGRTHRSAHPYTDLYGSTYPLLDGGQEYPLLLNLKGNWRDLKLGFVFDNFRQKVWDNYDSSGTTPFEISYRGVYASAEYGFKASEKMSVTPRLTYMWQRPWHVDDKTWMDESGANPFYRKSGQRVTASTTVSYDLLDCSVEGSCSENLTKWAREVNVIAGVEAYVDRGTAIELEETGFQAPLECTNDDPAMWTCPASVTHSNAGVFAQALDKNFLGTFVVGSRLEYNSVYGSSFVPRAAYTRVFDKAHVKVLASRAFRAPSYENISLAFPGDPVGPERTTVYELEAGVKVTQNAIITANVFDQTIGEPLVYYFDVDTNEEGYRNGTKTGSSGVELEARVRFPKWWATASYSYYSTSRCRGDATEFLGVFSCRDNEVDTYSLPGNRNELVGIPKHKLAFLGSVEIFKDVRLNPQAVWMAHKHYYSDYDVLSQGESETLLSLFASFDDIGVKGLDLSAGVHNILDTKWFLIQPYNGYHARVPGQSREFMMRLSWEM